MRIGYSFSQPSPFVKDLSGNRDTFPRGLLAMKRTPMLWLPVLLVFQASVAHGAPLQAGAARVEIPPPVGHPLWGYASRHDQPSIGVHDPLFARAVVLAAGPSRLAIVSLDLGRPPTRASVKALRQRVPESAGADHLFPVAGHTHHGPILELYTWPKEGKPYTAHLEARIGPAIRHTAKPCHATRATL